MLLESVFSPAECEALKRDMYALEEAYQAGGDLPARLRPFLLASLLDVAVRATLSAARCAGGVRVAGTVRGEAPNR